MPQFKLSTVEFMMGKKKISFEIVHNIEHIDGNVNSLYAATDNWLARTSKYTCESLCEYITSKGVHRAYTILEATTKKIKYS